MSTGDETTDGTAGAGPERTLDVRRVEEPFDRIAEALETLPAGGTLVLVNSFEPEPLYGVLEARGFDHETWRVGPGEWRVEITHVTVERVSIPDLDGEPHAGGPRTVRLRLGAGETVAEHRHPGSDVLSWSSRGGTAGPGVSVPAPPRRGPG